MTDREKAIVMAHTGICMLTGDKFQIFHKYVEDIMGRPVWTHEMAFDSIADEIRAKSKDDFIALCADESRSEIPNTCSDAISRKYILDLIDTKGANLDDDLLIVEQWIQDAPSVNPHPIECGDAISRQEALNAITMAEVRWQAVDNVNKLPSVTPQQRTGRWIQKEEEGDAEPFIIWECSECHCVDEDGKPSYKYCPQCGAKMEVEE